MNVHVKMPNPDKLLDGLDPTTMRLVRARAQNALAAKSKTLANKTTRERYAVPAAILRDAIRISRATAADPIAELRVVGTRTQASKFSISPREPNPKTQRKRPGTRVKFFTKSPAEVFLGAFTARTASGHIGVFRRSKTKRMRSDPKRFAIEEQTLIGPADMVRHREVMDALTRLIREESEIIYKRELAYALGTASASVKIGGNE